MKIVMVTKQSASVLPTTMTCPTISAQNSATPKETHTSTHAVLTFPSNTTVKHVNGKREDTKIMQQSITEWKYQNVIASITLASDGVRGLVKS